MDRLSIVAVVFMEKDWRFAKYISDHTDMDYELLVFDNTAKNVPLTDLWIEGVERSKSEYVCVMNNDVYVGPRWATLCLRAFQKDVVAVGPRIGGCGPQSQFVGLSMAPGIPLGKRIIATASELEGLEGPKTQEGFVSGCCTFLHRERFLSMGGYDPRFGFFGQDKDLYMTAKKRGLRSLIAMDAFAYHVGAVDRKKAVNVGRFDEDAVWGKRVKEFEEKWGMKDVGVPILFEEHPSRET